MQDLMLAGLPAWSEAAPVARSAAAAAPVLLLPATAKILALAIAILVVLVITGLSPEKGSRR